MFKIPMQTYPTEPKQAFQSWESRLALWLLVASVIYQAVLCALHTHGFQASPAKVGIAEALIFAACLPILLRRIHAGLLVLGLLIAVNLCLLGMFREYIDFKAFRDLLIPVLFFWLGRNIHDTALADRALKILVMVVIAVGLVELFFLDFYTRIFNIFSYYVAQGGASEALRMSTENRLLFNGERLEGVGRNFLPFVFGNHRVSSVFLEPVSLGNFAVILAAWGLSKGRDEIVVARFFVTSALVFVLLSDSRFGMAMVLLLMLLRAVLMNIRLHVIALFFPFIMVAILLSMPTLFPAEIGDDLLGRLGRTGIVLRQFDIGALLGLQGAQTGFGDQGYPYMLTRFGLVLCLVLWAAIWLGQVEDERATRFRALFALYAALILSVSGTSLFALKTSALLWFLLGCGAIDESQVSPLRHRARRIVNTYAI